MAKFIFTESQLELIKNNLNEDNSDLDNKYKIECEVEIENYGLVFRGKQIDDVSSPKITMTYNIDMEFRSYGIKDISPYNPQGPSELELEVIYYEDEEMDIQNEETVTIPLNWDDVIVEEIDNISYVGFDNMVTVRLKSDEQGGITSESITVYKKSI